MAGRAASGVSRSVGRAGGGGPDRNRRRRVLRTDPDDDSVRATASGKSRSYAEWLADRFATPVNGMWMPERVWEQSLTSDLAEAGVRYTLLDDFHFKNAGLGEDELHGYYITEDDGKLLSVFPGSERLRYTIPFREPQETIDYLRPIAEQQPGAVVVFGDDGEKFGSWPGTKEHVYEHGWLRRFFDALVENRSWLSVVTPTEALDQVPPLGKIYIPEGSYREMTEWALPTERLKEFDPPQASTGSTTAAGRKSRRSSAAATGGTSK